MFEQNNNDAVATADREAIARYLASRPHALEDIESVWGQWPDIAQMVLMKRLQALTDVLSNEALKAVADGKLDLPRLCREIAKPAEGI